MIPPKAVNRVSLGLALCLIAAAACGREGPGPIPQPSIHIQFDIADGTTNAAQGPFVVRLFGYGGALDDPKVKDLAAHLAITTWPEDEPVAVTTTTSTDPATDTAVVNVTSTAPLQDRWDALEFGASIAGLDSSQTFDNGTWGVRLRPGSHPVVRLLEFCGPADGGMKFIVSFSEYVAVDQPSAAFTVRQGGVDVPCRVNDAKSPVFYLFCDGLTAAAATVNLTDGQVRAADGSFLAPQTWSLDIVPAPSSGCFGYRTPI